MQYRTASKNEQALIDQEMENLALENPVAFSKAMLEDMEETINEAKELHKQKGRID
ncbi:hypothetical protein MMU07_04280 [Aquiflexum sp. LQ15W]|uniref:hypothetical protein n=1 Tax=Cognataquiflexum nitidum TaxID=2922272 RepID=UPI001F138E62|nr:hypothetical protein [Cognataquiflexum nitidum]MCH6198783.1 hypothetical protein [Cognataquiflexum nitidum]